MWCESNLLLVGGVLYMFCVFLSAGLQILTGGIRHRWSMAFKARLFDWVNGLASNSIDWDLEMSLCQDHFTVSSKVSGVLSTGPLLISESSVAPLSMHWDLWQSFDAFAILCIYFFNWTTSTLHFCKTWSSQGFLAKSWTRRSRSRNWRSRVCHYGLRYDFW